MPCGCTDKQLNKKLILESMKNLSIDEIIKLYQEGYRLDDVVTYNFYNFSESNFPHNSISIQSLTLANPNIIDGTAYWDGTNTHAMALWTNSGGYGYVAHIVYDDIGSWKAQSESCWDVRTGLMYLTKISISGSTTPFLDIHTMKCGSDTGQTCFPTASCIGPVTTSRFTGIPVRAIDTIKPDTPPNLTVTPGNQLLDVSWGAVTNTDIFAYYMSIVDTSTSPPNIVDFGYLPYNARSYRVSNLTNEKTYEINVLAVNHSYLNGFLSTITGTPSLVCPTPVLSISCPTAPVTQNTSADIVANITTAGTPGYVYKLYRDTTLIDTFPTTGTTNEMTHTFSHLFNETLGIYPFKVEITDNCPSGAKQVSSNICNIEVQSAGGCPIPVVSIMCPTSVNQGTVETITADITTPGTPGYIYKLYRDITLLETFPTTGKTTSTSHSFSHTFSETAGLQTFRIEVTDSCTPAQTVSDSCIITIQAAPPVQAGAGGALMIAGLAAILLAYYMTKKRPKRP